ncbi:MAG TPA: DUF2520 domain-containing protein [Burkholderiales bacterium]|nr:DUF2520 domain-containing protein [Burkholderiales bacterium]
MSAAFRIGFIGTGRVAQALAVGLDKAGWSVAAVSNRNFAPASRLAAQLTGCIAHADAQAVADGADLVFLTVPDDAIEGIAQSLRWRRGVALVHCSGATGLTVLQSAASQGAAIGAFHPLQGFSDAQIALRTLPGCAAAIEAAEPLYTKLKEIAAVLGMRPFALPENARALYHLSGSYAASFLAVLLHEAANIWQSFGIPRKEALAALSMLAQGSLTSIAQQGPVQALTGPISRGDAGTLALHLQSLRDEKPESLPLYVLLAEHSIEMAQQRGVPEEAIERMRITLEEAKRI